MSTTDVTVSTPTSTAAPDGPATTGGSGEPPAIDEQAIGEFAGRLMGMFTSCMLTYMVDIGHRTGLFDGRRRGPRHERRARPPAPVWTSATSASGSAPWRPAGIIDYDAPDRHLHPAAGTRHLPDGHRRRRTWRPLAR